MSNSKIVMSSREFAKGSGRKHGNVLSMLRGAINRGELDLQESYYTGKGEGQYVEFNLSLEDFERISSRLTEREMKSVRRILTARAAKAVAAAERRAYIQEQCEELACKGTPELKHVDAVIREEVTARARPADFAQGFGLPYGAAPVSLVVEAPSQVPADGQPLTMSSLEIAKLTGKRHDHVIRDIRSMLEEIKDDPNLGHVICSTDSRGYTSEIKLPRRETDILLTGYSVTLRARVIDRWRELEAEVAKPAPANLNDPAALRGLLLGYTEQVLQLEHQVGVQAARIEEDKPKAAFYDDVAYTGELKGVAEVAKGLGTGEKRLFEYLRQHRILIGGSGDNKNQPFQVHIDAGRLSVKWNNYRVPETGEVKVRPRPLFTGKGITWIHDFVAKHGREGLE